MPDKVASKLDQTNTIAKHMSEVTKGTTEREIALVEKLHQHPDKHTREHAEEIAHVHCTLG